MTLVKVTVNGKEVGVDKRATVLQACESAGEEIPRFCYHERLEIAGNCRMCLVQIEGGPPKPAASCAMPVADGMVVHTNTPMVKKAREGVMEFLLINHPLDCPICDQGGECDLQDQAMTYGRGGSRYKENKRAVKDKNMGPLIKTHMTRCIQCTRCIRFMDEIAVVEALGAVGRGEDMEVTTFIEQGINSELSGNIIDLCPVGALTSKPYAFKARSWELKGTETIDVLDAVGSNIRVDSRGREVMRILPRLNEDINEEWISDKTRFAYDGLKLQRLDRPMIKKGSKFAAVSWEQAYKAIEKKIKGLKGEKMAAIAGDLADVESMLVLKEFMVNLGSQNIDCRQDGAKLDAKNRAGYIFNSTIAGIEEADACLLIGANPRHEAPLVNARLRKRFQKGGFNIASVGADIDLTYKVNSLGQSLDILDEIVAGSHPFSKILKAAKRPLLIIGPGAYTRKDGAAILAKASELAEKFKMVNADKESPSFGFNILHTAAARVGGLDIGFVPGENGKDVDGILKAAKTGEIKLVYLLGADEIDMSALKDAFVIYQGHHGDKGAHHADIILPGAAYTEKNATYVNTEGRPQQAKLSVFPPGKAKEDWRIISELAKIINPLPYESLKQIREQMAKISPVFSATGEVQKQEWKKAGRKGNIDSAPLENFIEDFYMTDPISRASKTLAACSLEFVPRTKKKGEAA